MSDNWDIERFVFEFSDEENEKVHIYQFPVSGFTSEIMESEAFELMRDAMENAYGIHDGTNPSYGPDDAVAFTTYEVDPDKHMELMEKWRRFFSQDLGYPAGDIEGPDTHGWEDEEGGIHD